MKNMVLRRLFLSLCFAVISIKITHNAASGDVWSQDSGRSKLVAQPTSWHLLKQGRAASDTSFYNPTTMDEFQKIAVIFFNILLNGIAPDFTTKYLFYQTAPLPDCLQQIQESFWTTKAVNYHTTSPAFKSPFSSENIYTQEITLAEANLFTQIAAQAILCKYDEHQEAARKESFLWWLLGAAYLACNLKLKADMIQKCMQNKKAYKRNSIMLPSGSLLQHHHPDFELKDALLKGAIITPYLSYFLSLGRARESILLSLLNEALDHSSILVQQSS